ncbi:kinetochore protein SPC24 [Vulcanisaeta sp. JCM 16159]|uniref:kinetochore protein SPC24 n=1 Tax=Vulcanisaeta sp. JCM 16159 TaxID=1295371 RepID=UPI000A3DDA7F|nr:kinetochore protein SPC24 [Vulcanisaeta sp. JCM 16159]
MAKDINELRNRVMRIEQTINELIERLNRLESVGPQGTRTSNTAAREGSTISNELPDFLSNNPWIEVLRRRGGGNG